MPLWSLNAIHLPYFIAEYIYNSDTNMTKWCRILIVGKLILHNIYRNKILSSVNLYIIFKKE